MKLINKIKTLLPGAKRNATRDDSPLRIDKDELTKLAVVFETLNKFKQAGLLHCDFRPSVNSITISMFLARNFYYDENPEAWPHFLGQLEQWGQFQYSIMVYNREKAKFMADYEAKEYKKNPRMTAEDRAGIKMEASEIFHRQITEHPETVPPFMFYVIGATADAKPLLVARRILNDATGQYEFKTLPFKDDYSHVKED